jgi:hypothetical protein
MENGPFIDGKHEDLPVIFHSYQYVKLAKGIGIGIPLGISLGFSGFIGIALGIHRDS